MWLGTVVLVTAVIALGGCGREGPAQPVANALCNPNYLAATKEAEGADADVIAAYRCIGNRAYRAAQYWEPSQSTRKLIVAGCMAELRAASGDERATEQGATSNEGDEKLDGDVMTAEGAAFFVLSRAKACYPR